MTAKKIPLAIETIVKVAKQSKTEKLQSAALKDAWQAGWDACKEAARVDAVNAKRLADEAPKARLTWVQNIGLWLARDPD